MKCSCKKLLTLFIIPSDVDSDVEMYNSPPKQLTNKHLHPAQKVRQRRRARTASLEDEDADLQGKSRYNIIITGLTSNGNKTKLSHIQSIVFQKFSHHKIIISLKIKINFLSVKVFTEHVVVLSVFKSVRLLRRR